MSSVLSKLNSIHALLGSLPTRRQIMKSDKFPVQRTIRIRVERTMPFEYISNAMPPFLGIWGSACTSDYSEYDNTLSNITAEKTADVYILWLDWRFYRDSMTAERVIHWLEERVDLLRKETDKPIFVNNWPELTEIGETLFSPQAGGRGWIRELNALLSGIFEHKKGCGVIDLAGLALELKIPFYDPRNDQVSHYPFSDQASIAIARHLGVHLLPSILMPRLKALALDLDDTLYSGVLGEDDVSCSEGHQQLHKLLLRLKQSGLLLTICSRNEESDVKELFDRRKDFPLKWDDFAAVCANWLPKSENINTLAQKLNIDPSSFLFVDDNPAELLKVGAELPSVHLLRADKNAEETIRKISHYPGLYQLRSDDSAAVRTTDIQANTMRENLKKTASSYTSYLESLQMIVRMFVNRAEHSSRLYELSQKTNQFNLALRRMSETEADRVTNEEHHLTMTVQLSDSLTDSGIIGAFVCRIDDRKAYLMELLFSCRALGREIETVAFAYFLERLMHLGVQRLAISVTEGPRNTPARQWLSRFVQENTDDLSAADLLSCVKAACANHPAKVEEMI